MACSYSVNGNQRRFSGWEEVSPRLEAREMKRICSSGSIINSITRLDTLQIGMGGWGHQKIGSKISSCGEI
jgi:hypothetical protein